MLLALWTATAVSSELHVPAPDGWRGFDEEYRYGRETLWEYINGAAELFLNYQFSELVVADFEQGDVMLTVCVYDMGFPIDAFGIFEAEKPARAEVLADVGSAAVLQPPYQGLMIKDRFYVKIEAGGGDVSAATLRTVLGDVAAGLPGDDGLPPELDALPAEGRVPGTVAFAGANFLGFEDLSGCLYADYEGGDDDGYRLFVMNPSAAFLRNDGGRWAQSELDGRLLYSRSIPYRGVVVLAGDENRLLGVCDVDGVERAVELLTARMR